MPKWKKDHTTPHVCVPLSNPRRNIPSDHDQQARYWLQHSVLDSFHTKIQEPVFLIVGPDAKLDMLKLLIWTNCLIFIWTLPPLKTHHSVELPRMVKTLLKPLTFILQMWNQESGSSLPH